MVSGWSTDESRSSVRDGTSEMRESRCLEVSRGLRRRRRSLARGVSFDDVSWGGICRAYSALSNWSTSDILATVPVRARWKNGLTASFQEGLSFDEAYPHVASFIARM
jgi:hypothetical protein